MTADITQSITDAIVSAPVSVTAKEAAAPLVDAYVERFAGPDSEWEHLAVEVPWYLWLNDCTLLVGVMDAIRKREWIEGVELKTRRAPKVKRDGQPYKGDTEQDWLAEISNGPQLSIYGLAMQRGTFVGYNVPKSNGSVRIRVRAVCKSVPPTIWPTSDDGLFEFPPALLEKTAESVLSAAESIRAQRRLGTVPWQMMGSWCSRFGRDCQHIEVCRARTNPPDRPSTQFSTTDPGAAAIEAALKDWNGDDLVILSASGYSDWGTCSELWRLNAGGYYPPEEAEALAIGTAFHAGCAALNRHLQKGLDRNT